MTDPVDPVRAAGDRRRNPRRQTDASFAEPARPGAAGPPALAAPVKPQADPQPTLAAHLIGQSGQKRGLRGGPETLAKARAAYLSAEWSGPDDRRTRTGIISKTKV